MIPQPHGGALLPGGTGAGGRKPDAFKQMCRALSSSQDVYDTVLRVLQDPKSPAFIGALKWATENGYGRPRETIEMFGANGGPIVVQYAHEAKKRTAS